MLSGSEIKEELPHQLDEKADKNVKEVVQTISIPENSNFQSIFSSTFNRNEIQNIFQSSYALNAQTQQQGVQQKCQISQNVGSFVLDSCLNSCSVHPDEPISYIDISINTTLQRFYCIECFSAMKLENRGYLISLRKFLRKKETDKYFFLLEDESKEQYFQFVQENIVHLQKEEGIRLEDSKQNVTKFEETIESCEEIQKKAFYKFKADLSQRINQELQKVISSAEYNINLQEEKKKIIQELYNELSDTNVLYEIFEKNRNESSNLAKELDEYITGCHLKVKQLKDAVDELKNMRNKFSQEGVKEIGDSIVEQVGKINFYSSIKIENQKVPILQESVLSSFNEHSNCELVISLIQRIPGIPEKLVAQLNERIRKNPKMFDGIDFSQLELKISEEEEEKESKFLEGSQAEIKQAYDSIPESISQKDLNAEDIDDSLSQMQLKEFIQSALDDKVTLKDIRNTYNLNSKNFIQQQISSPELEFQDREDAMPLPNFNNGSQEYINFSQQQSQLRTHPIRNDEITFAKNQSQIRDFDERDDQSLKDNQQWNKYFSSISPETKINTNQRVEQKFQLQLKKSKLGSNADLQITSNKGVISIEQPNDHYMHYIISKDSMDSSKSYQFLFQLCCSKNDYILIGIIPKENINECMVHDFPFYKSFNQTSSEQISTSCEKIAKGKTIQLQEGKDLKILMKVSLSQGELSFSDYPDMQNINCIRKPEILKDINQFHLSIAISKPKLSSEKGAKLRVQVLEAKIEEDFDKNRKSY